MSDKPQPGDEGKPADPQTFSQEIRHSNVSARVPEKVARGAFSTGALVLQGPTEFVIDFLQRLSQPNQVVARVVLPIDLMPRFIEALRDNLDRFKAQFGPPAALPTSTPPPKPPSIDEIYDTLKLPDEVMSGSYANNVMISHSPAEFCLEFITSFYPRAAVSTRVFLSAPQVPHVLNTLSQSWQNHLAKLQAGGQQPPPPSHPGHKPGHN